LPSSLLSSESLPESDDPDDKLGWERTSIPAGSVRSTDDRRSSSAFDAAIEPPAVGGGTAPTDAGIPAVRAGSIPVDPAFYSFSFDSPEDWEGSPPVAVLRPPVCPGGFGRRFAFESPGFSEPDARPRELLPAPSS